jgi:acyl dehydratase
MRKNLSPKYKPFLLFQKGKCDGCNRFLKILQSQKNFYFYITIINRLMITIQNYTEFESHLGKEIGTSGWHVITQEQINKFAEATIDHQWIHTDPERAATESPFGTTIAHGYLTVSLLPYFWHQIADVQNLKMQINYSIENIRFAQPVKVNSRVRLKAKLAAIINLRGITKANIAVEMEIEGEKKPAYTGEVVFLYHFAG